MARLPASIIRKYGVTKKAWAVYRGRGRARTSVSHAMPRRRRTRRAGRRLFRRGRSTGGGLNIRSNLMPIALATLAEPFVDNTIRAFVPAQFNTLPFGIQTDDVAKVVAGIYLGRKGGLVGKTATFMGIYGLRNIVAQATGGVLMPTAAGASVGTGATF